MKKLIIAVMVIAVIALFYGTGAWKEQTRYTVTTMDELTISAAGGRDSTAVFPCDREVTIAILPGYSTADTLYASNADSTKCMFYARGWTDKQRTHCLGNVGLWGPGNVFALTKAATTASEDSGSKSLYFGRSANPDSTSILKELWPYIDVVAVDTNSQCGKNSAYKIKYIGFSPNVD